MEKEEHLIKRLHEHFAIQNEPRITSMDRKLIIQVATPGWLSLKQNPHIPKNRQEVSDALLGACDEGAQIIHMHARDEAGVPSEDPDLPRRIYEPVLKKYPKAITSTHIMWNADKRGWAAFEEYAAKLLGAGVEYVQTTPVLFRGAFLPKQFVFDLEGIRDAIPQLEKRGIKPECQIYDTFGLELFTEAADVITRRPPWVNLHLGKHHAVPVKVDPWAHLQLITEFHTARAMLPRDTVLGVYVGGRNWLPLTVLALTLGADVIRVGVEDCLWVYPHRDDIIKRDADMVKKIVTIARELGRELATMEEARKILGFKP